MYKTMEHRSGFLYSLILGIIVIGTSVGAFTQSCLPRCLAVSHNSPHTSSSSSRLQLSRNWYPIVTTSQATTTHHEYLLPTKPKRKRRHSIVSLHATKPDLKDELTTSSTTTTTSGGRTTDAERRLGVLVLFTVPLAWGTFEPAVRYVYEIQPPVPGFVFSVGYYLFASVTLALLVLVSSLLRRQQADVTPLGTAADADTALPLRGGLELGTYLFVGNALQVLGLKTVPSDRAAFLLQLTTIFVPLVQSVIAGDLQAVPTRTWIACAIALAGVFVIGLDGNENVAVDTTTVDAGISTGDLLIVGAAFAYTFHCIRLEKFAKQTSALKLAASKAATETVLCILLVIALMAFGAFAASPEHHLLNYAQEEGQDISRFFDSFSQQWTSGSLLTSPAFLPAVGAAAWAGWVTVAYTIYAQSFGQSRVSPADANLIYTFQPICTAIFAWLLLGETLGPLGYLGGALIGGAVYLVVGNDSSDDVTKDQPSE